MSNQLFRFGDDWKNNACINSYHDSIALYIDGYKEAADHLAKKVIESGQDQDILVYPIAFLFRQYIELELKWIIRESRVLLNDGLGFPEHHEIKNLLDIAWKLMNEIIDTFCKEANEYITKEDLEIIEKIISDFVEIDPGSFAFRYPTDKQGNNTMEGLKYINIRILAEQTNLLSEKLNKFTNVLGVLSDWQADLRSSY